jgi:hypothetical protein
MLASCYLGREGHVFFPAVHYFDAEMLVNGIANQCDLDTLLRFVQHDLPKITELYLAASVHFIESVCRKLMLRRVSNLRKANRNVK